LPLLSQDPVEYRQFSLCHTDNSTLSKQTTIYVRCCENDEVAEATDFEYSRQNKYQLCS